MGAAATSPSSGSNQIFLLHQTPHDFLCYGHRLPAQIRAHVTEALATVIELEDIRDDTTHVSVLTADIRSCGFAPRSFQSVHWFLSGCRDQVATAVCRVEAIRPAAPVLPRSAAGAGSFWRFVGIQVPHDQVVYFPVVRRRLFTPIFRAITCALSSWAHRSLTTACFTPCDLRLFLALSEQVGRPPRAGRQSKP